MEPIDALFQSAHEREAHTRQVSARVIAQLADVEADIEGRLVTRLARLSAGDRRQVLARGLRQRGGTERLQAALETIRDIAARWRRTTEAEIKSAARAVAAAEIALQNDALDDEGVSEGRVTPAAAVVAAMAAPMMAKPVRQYFAEQQTSVERTLYDTVRDGLDVGAAAGAIGIAIIGTGRRADGAIQRNRNGVRMLVPTTLNHVASISTIQTYKARGVERWRFLSVADGRISQVCKGLSNTVWRVDDPAAPYPPRHARCRSQPLFMGAEIDGTQATNMAGDPGQRPAELSYEDLLRRQPVAWQREQFTALQWKLWREGGVSLRGMVDTLGTRGLTDKELELRYARILRDLRTARARRAA